MKTGVHQNAQLVGYAFRNMELINQSINQFICQVSQKQVQ